MLRFLIHNPRRRGLVGALLFGSAPYIVAASNHGIFLGFNGEGWVFVLVTGCILAMFGFGVFQGGVAADRSNGASDDATVSTNHSHQDQLTHNASYAWMRDVYERPFER